MGRRLAEMVPVSETGPQGGTSDKQTISVLATKHQHRPNQITQWKRQAIENLAKAFDGRASDAQDSREVALTKPTVSRSSPWPGAISNSIMRSLTWTI
jgi:hypothetical protein